VPEGYYFFSRSDWSIKPVSYKCIEIHMFQH
jgi:hypothetical protein